MGRAACAVLVGAMAMCAAAVAAAPLERSVRPEPRAATVQPAAAVAPLGRRDADRPEPAVRPKARPGARETPAATMTVSTKNLAFRRWIADFRVRALRQGVSAAGFDRAFADVAYNADVIAKDRNQAEFNRTLWDYLDRAVSETRIANGRAALDTHARLLAEIEARHGVDKEIVVAVWGMESAYGTFRGDLPVIEALATLAYDGRRGTFFEAQLVAALMILDDGDTTPGAMTGSWAGAMGHTQFIPTSYQAYAVDFDGDGRRDIWSDDPADALASTAAYLKSHGWTQGLPWGVEVTLADDFDYGLAKRPVVKMPSQWAALGVRGTDGAPVSDYGPASVLAPAGADGAAFLIFSNFAVIERYNAADAYVIGVGHLADRIAGRPPIQADWPREDRALTSAERKELQRRLTAQGFSTRGVDGRIGPNTIEAVRGYQRSLGLTPDGYASPRLLDRLR
ncbi:lytic murein transglycosylase [Rhodobacteraceae bacterium CCMM004]|nr:lytic murein transglycosylase [Rhodobacteraceae bacterium CCMM004]